MIYAKYKIKGPKCRQCMNKKEKKNEKKIKETQNHCESSNKKKKTYISCKIRSMESNRCWFIIEVNTEEKYFRRYMHWPCLNCENVYVFFPDYLCFEYFFWRYSCETFMNLRTKFSKDFRFVTDKKKCLEN